MCLLLSFAVHDRTWNACSSWWPSVVIAGRHLHLFVAGSWMAEHACCHPRGPRARPAHACRKRIAVALALLPPQTYMAPITSLARRCSYPRPHISIASPDVLTEARPSLFFLPSHSICAAILGRDSIAPFLDLTLLVATMSSCDGHWLFPPLFLQHLNSAAEHTPFEQR